eukprot:6296722-Pyramimonas_sp.AAC.1
MGGGRSWIGDIFWRPLNELLHLKAAEDDSGEVAVGMGGAWGFREQRTLRGMVIGSHWCQHRLRQNDQDLSYQCLLCGELSTPFHRHFACPAKDAWRRDNLSAASALRLTFCPVGLQERFARGTLPDPCQLHSRRPWDPTW